MSEEKPNFKVTDRRLFNPDGTPRDVVREEEPAPVDTTEAATGATQQTGAATTRASESASEPPREAGRGKAAPEQSAQEDEDSQEFMLVVEFIASFAVEALGMAAHPGAVGQPPQVNLPLARQCIDMLATIERKTRGNLNADEQHFLTLIISQLRMQYVQLSQPRAAADPPRGFSGSDITGGR